MSSKLLKEKMKANFSINDLINIQTASASHRIAAKGLAEACVRHFSTPEHDDDFGTTTYIRFT